MYNKKVNKKGEYSKAKLKVTATETSRKVEVEIPENEVENVTAGLFKINHSKGLYNEFFTLNQEFMMYVLSVGLKGREWEIFIWLLANMDYGNKVLINQEFLQKTLSQTQSQISKGLTKLKNNKIILESKLNRAKYEVSFNYDILNPQLGFKGKANKENVKQHKDLISQETPYQRQYNLSGNIDLINKQTGEIFKTVEVTISDREKNQRIAEKNNK